MFHVALILVRARLNDTLVEMELLKNRSEEVAFFISPSIDSTKDLLDNGMPIMEPGPEAQASPSTSYASLEAE